MKIVIDTSVFISALFGGISRRVIDLLDTGVFTLCVSKYIVAEYITVLHRLGANRSLLEKVIEFCDEGDNVLDTLSTQRLDLGEFTPIYKFLECALLAKADYIITDSPEYYESKQLDPTQIATPLEFLEIIEHAKRKK